MKANVGIHAEKGNYSFIAGWGQTGRATREIRVKFPQKARNIFNLRPSSAILVNVDT